MRTYHSIAISSKKQTRLKHMATCEAPEVDLYRVKGDVDDWATYKQLFSRLLGPFGWFLM